MVLTLENINQIEFDRDRISIIDKSHVRGNNTIPKYHLNRALDIQLSDGTIIYIPRGFIWDLSSVPRIFWSLFPTDGDFEIGVIIHDYLYRTQIKSKEFADLEMYKWSKVMSGTHNKRSARNFDNYTRYKIVKYFGHKTWNRNTELLQNG